MSFWYGKYYIPNNLQNYVAKYYLTDGRRNPNSEGYQTSTRFEKYLMDCGFQTATDRDFGITALRWAGMKAGIGIIRKNNFFYTEKGSYQYLEAFLIDQPLQYIPLPSTAPTAPLIAVKALESQQKGPLRRMTERSFFVSSLTPPAGAGWGNEGSRRRDRPESGGRCCRPWHP